MSSNVVVALIGFGETLQNSNVATKTKLQVLGTLNEVTLTLSELSESGVGRAVSKLKSAPGELGNTARLLVSKWKRLLRDHMAKTSLSLPMHDVEADCEVSTDVGDTGCDVNISQSDQSKKIPDTNHTEKHAVNVKPISDMPTKTRPKTVKTNVVPTHPVRSPSPTSIPSCSHTNSHPLSQTKSDSLAGKRKAPQLSVDSLDSSSGLSFLESLSVGLSNSSSSSCLNRKKSKKSKIVSKSSSASFSPSDPPVQATSMCPKPSTKFTEEVLSALADEVFDRPDIIHKSVDMAPADASDFEDGDLKFKSKRVLWVPKPSRSANQSCGRGQSGGSPHDPANDAVNPRSLVDLCLDVVEQNLSRVDHVGQVPYELLARTLRHASAEDLARIEHCNPVSFFNTSLAHTLQSVVLQNSVYIKILTPADASDFEDGDLKFKSKRVLWVPKPSRSANQSCGRGQSGGSPHDPANDAVNPRSLVDLCLDVVEQNLSRVDHVGQVPYELLARTLRHASAEDLARIEHCNPQFVGCSDHLWQRHVQRAFHGLKEAAHPRPNETWCAFYERLCKEESNRLNRIISHSARKIKEEQEARRTTLTTEVITPHQIQRRAARHNQPATSTKCLTPSKLSRPSSSTPVFRPYNVSRPSCDSHTPLARDPPTAVQRPVVINGLTSGPSGNGGGGGGLLDKLRKQFRSGRLR
ncbi:hypothetical protein AHF37_04947 [Paragonimus kellicotti]|nr:hypothetical protein AHF37_04947 [Paragonimus kellicotti]